MLLIDRVLQRWRGSVARRWVPAGSRILDVGCHRGEFFSALGWRLGYGVGVDPLAAPYETTRWEVIRDRFPPAVELPAGSFDVIVMLATLEHLRDKEAVAAECHRLLRPGGRVVATVPSPLIDGVVSALSRLGLAHGMSLEEHHGFAPARTRDVFSRIGFMLVRWEVFQCGLNNLFVFVKPPA